MYSISCSITSDGGLNHTKSIAHVDSSGGSLQDTKGLDDGRRHPVLGLVDLEVLERSFGLGSPVLVGRDLDLAEGIGLGSRVGRHPDCGCVQVALES